MISPVVARNLGFSFPGEDDPLFAGIDLEVRRGEVVAVVGLSGSGKTTLCYCLSGIIPLIREGRMAGRVTLNGTCTRDMSLPQVATTLGIVFQNPDTQLFFPVVADEIAFGPENLCLPPEEIEERIGLVLQKVGMERFRHRNPHQLSGGQKQLIALAAVLSLDPEILILDEVMSQLDAEGRGRIRQLIGMLRDEGRAVVMVEHNPDNLDVADRVMLLRGGRLTAIGGNLYDAL
ncbi:MAG: ABC transporter ATP-binding protein [Bacillota bacterium]